MKALHSIQFRRPLDIIFALTIFALYGWIAWLPDLRLAIPEWIGISAGIVMLLTLFTSDSNSKGWSEGFIILVAAVLRMMFLWRSPELSDDIFRYVLDGMMLLSGHNPFAAAPADLTTENPVILGLMMRINHAELPSIYPPAAQFVFAVGAFIGGIFGMKLFLVLLDLLTCILIIKILAALRLDRNFCVLYAWHPLPVIEIAASGHIDAAAVFFTCLTVFFLLGKKSFDQAQSPRPNQQSRILSLFSGQGFYGFIAGVFFAAAVLTKWIPLILMPGILLLASPEKRRYCVYGFLISFAVMCSIFWPDILNCFYTLSVYVANWEFSGFAFRWLRAFTGSGIIARAILATAFILSTAMIYFRYISPARRQNAIIVKIPLNPPLSKGDFNSSLRQKKVCGTYHPIGIPDCDGKDIFKGFYAIAMAFLLLTPTLHPWYGLILAAFLPFAAGPAGLVLSWSVFLAYRVLILYGLTGEWIESDKIPFLIAIAPAAALAATIINKFLKHRIYPPSTKTNPV